MTTKRIQVQNPPDVVIGTGFHKFTRPYYSGGLVNVKINTSCRYCGKPVTYIRGGLIQGGDYHGDCHANSEESKKQFEEQRAAILNGLTESEYQAKYQRAWNE